MGISSTEMNWPKRLFQLLHHINIYRDVVMNAKSAAFMGMPVFVLTFARSLGYGPW